MATSREERMQQRMRGAGRHEVADDSFGFVLPVVESSPDPPPSLPPIRSEPNTSAKRRRLNNEPGSPTSQPSNVSAATGSSDRLSSGQKSIQPKVVEQDVVHKVDFPQPEPPPTTTRISARLGNLDLNQGSIPGDDAHSDTHTGLPAPETVTEEPRVQRGPDNRQELEGSDISLQSMLDLLEEVTESPVTAPGSGRRRRIEPTDALTQSTKLQRMVMAEEEAGISSEAAASSPLARKTRQSIAAASTRSSRTTRASARKTPSSPAEALHGSSPLARHSHKSGSSVATSSARSTRSQNRRSTPGSVNFDAEELSSLPDAAGIDSARKPRPEQNKARTISESPYEIGESEQEDQREGPEPQAEPQVEPDNREAEEVDNYEAARRIGRKRPRFSPRQRQPLNTADDVDSPTASIERPAKRRRPRQTKVSPAKQSQPGATKEKVKKKKTPSRRKSDGSSIPITVQRYTKPLRRNDSNPDEDILNVDIPFTDHKSPNVVDVVLQMCEESMEKYLSALHEEASQADGPASRKIYRIKLRAVEAFQEELRTRLQGQTIALDNLRTLKKRVRAAQKEKVSLRNDILRIRAEREQVSLKIDAVRMRHEAANKETLQRLGLSSTMDDVELAVENGKVAPEPNAKEQKTVELANLDLLISQITNQVSVAGESGGILRQIKDFNMFLERAAIALEGR